ncbi:outer membrane immunogenic protein [Mesorhizobium soli]|uniref:outer membrane protein n=1 Tax=Pseudaminobacter soli (ex Li et al. 2025) TaxID=1295366 RepID=UPI0024768E0A|nr:porin family protein [Mesorhizobium soli]MDH6231061.1 outer membrane immunogenic protein [Mesorhizobium soli]
MFSKRIAVLAAFSTLLSTGAFAADIVSTEPAPEVIPVFSWTGAYVGLNAGFGGGKFKHEMPGSGMSFNPQSSGFVGGVQVGYNYQIDQWVVGAEADFQGASIKGETEFDSGAKLGTKLDWYGTVRARAGVLANDRLLVYATGGLAYGRTKTHMEAPDAGVSDSKTKAGWTVGAGVEYAVTDHVSLKTEYAYTDLGKARVFDSLGSGLDRKVNFHTVKFGINYKF